MAPCSPPTSASRPSFNTAQKNLQKRRDISFAHFLKTLTLEENLQSHAEAMGSILSCMSGAEESNRRRRPHGPPPRRRNSSSSFTASNPNSGVGSSSRWRSSKKEESLIHEQALAAAAAILIHQQNGGAGGVAPPFDRSSSLRYPPANVGKKQGLARSSSSRARSLTDPIVDPHQLVNQV